ncbi:MAG: ABC transporter ATP-binding protein/permease [Defluviitaleaceae bacterium]|nr:ABC transporter ATP-binding protein/permease [Defluviitaleaceae bacterium]
MLNKKKYSITDMFSLAFKASPIWASIVFFNNIIIAVLPVFTIFISARFIDLVLTSFQNNTDNENAFALILLLGAIGAYKWIMGDVIKFAENKIILSSRIKYQLSILEKRAKLDYKYIEDQNIYDLIERVNKDADQRILKLFKDILTLIAIIIQVLSILIILIEHIWWVGIITLIFSIPTFYLGIKAGNKSFKVEKLASKMERKSKYLYNVLSERESSEERILFGYSEKLSSQFADYFNSSAKMKEKVSKKSYVSMKIGGVLVVLLTGLLMLTMLPAVADDTISIGLFVSLISACMNLTITLSWDLSWQLKQLTINREYLKELTLFSNLEEIEYALEVREQKIPLFESLEFKNVSFKYPNSSSYTLQNVSFKMLNGKSYALVGENGAGKSTLVKLLTKQYLEYEGDIFLNGISLKSYPLSEIKSMFSAVYQDFARYPLTIEENMIFDNNNQQESLWDTIYDFELKDLIESTSQGLDTPLGKVLKNGIDLSGGEWQRLVLVRGALNPAPIKILDEPTSALDPLSEIRLYKQFEKIINRSTSILITHRLGSIKMVDNIFVFENGNLIEQGKHQDLINKKGKYFDMYNSQSSWYKENIS